MIYKITEEDKEIKSKYDKNISVSSSRLLKNTQSHYSNGLYYRYINKKEYINEKLSLCDEYENKAEMYDTAYVKHRKNLLLSDKKCCLTGFIG